MVNLETLYLGIKLKNPIIVSSSGLTDAVDKIRILEEKGAGAVVLKSLFEEQINYETNRLIFTNDHPEAADYLSIYTRENSINDYLKLISEAKNAVSIPVFASINCYSSEGWIEFAGKIQEAGADALELNIYVLPTNKNAQASEYEYVYFDLAGKIKKEIDIPVAIKLGNHFTNLLALVNRLNAAGINGIVLFNRFFEPDIDIEKMKMKSSEIFSSPSDIRHSLRWIGIIYDKIPKIDLAASTGIHDGQAVIKQLLAGAKVTQVCSTIYKNGPGQLIQIINKLTSWMKEHGFSNIEQFRGKLSYKSIPNPEMYERAQFMKYFSSIH
ncbi:MAG: dihydroorotate dehydrogenase-like protein [Bacteroidales bacterium]|nr:dihydroorotate dehydrogenase-like protein [Bacteroidales bacterium]